MTITEMCKKAHKTAKAKGFWDGLTLIRGRMSIPTNTLLAKLALIHSEVSEAVEEVRLGNTETRFLADNSKVDTPNKVESIIESSAFKKDIVQISSNKLCEELADIIICTAELSEALGYTLEEMILIKMNRSGPDHVVEAIFDQWSDQSKTLPYPSPLPRKHPTHPNLTPL